MLLFGLLLTLFQLPPCEGGGFSAKVRVNIYATFGSTELLVASQVVEIPCGTVVNNNMTRPNFNTHTTEVGSEGVPLVTDYLDKNDENGTTFKEVITTLHDSMKSIEK